ncbi:acyl-CoA dehydrogenase family protein [Oligoflexia bacterium]|nr:acyl-CoA dehydrogenase family protein [Oligoflexia bacterium]
MLNFELSEEQVMVKKTARDFARKEIAPVARQLDEEERFDPALVEKMGKLGFFSLLTSPEYGGTSMGYVAYCTLVAELASVDGSTAATVAAANSLGIGPIYYFGSEEQKRTYLPDLCQGKYLSAFGLTEPNAGSDAGGTQTTAKLDGEEWVVNGSKIFITNGASDLTSVVTVQAVTGTKADGSPEFSCILVPTSLAGFTRKKMTGKLMWRSSDTAELYFDNCRVPKENLLGKQGEGFQQMLQTLDSGRLAIAAMGLGGARGAFEEALKYAKERQQFGKPICKFQAIAFKLADMATEVEAAENLVYKACWLKDSGRPFEKEAAMAKLYCSEVFGRVATQAVQIHGGYGLMKEYPVERFFRDQKLLEIGEGTSEVQRIVISRALGC